MMQMDRVLQASTQVELGVKFGTESLTMVLADLSDVACQLRELEMPVSIKAAEKARAELERFGGELAPAKWAMRHLYESVIAELESIRLFSMPAMRAAYYEQPELFGAEVNARFAAACHDIEEAGSCFACGRWTATVFHLMRVLEHGLRKMAVSMGVIQAPDADVAQWGDLISKIENELDLLRNNKKSLQKNIDLQRYSDLATEFRYFKNAWRNHVAHARISYDEAQAERILRGVRDFMGQAATVLV